MTCIAIANCVEWQMQLGDDDGSGVNDGVVVLVSV